MVFNIPTDLPPELVPLSWLIGRWEGRGYITDHGQIQGEYEEQEFIQEATFLHQGLPYLEYCARSWLIEENGEKGRPLTLETGIWQLERKFTYADPGPGMFPAAEEHALVNAEQVEELRNEEGGFNLHVSLVHPGGISELYVGEIKQARINLATDAVLQAPGAKEYTSATRMYGLVNGELLWAWDLAALGKSLNTHASAQLKKV